MNKLLKTFGAFVIALGIFGMAKVNAAENATLTIKTDNTTLSKGSTFSVAISAGSEAGINGLTGRISYNTDVLEYVSKSFKVDESFMNMGTFPEIAVITNEADIKKAEICTMEFKIKEDTTATSTDITLTQSQETGKLLVSLMEGQDAEFDDKVLTINIKEDGSLPIDPILDRNLTRIQISKQPNKTSYKVGETFDPTGMKVIALYDDGTQKELTNYTCEKQLRATDVICLIHADICV